MTNNSIDAMNIVQRTIKRILDIIGALTGLIVFSPLFVIIFILIKKEGDGPVIFSQERIGKNGQPFKIFKFRTMVVDAEESGVALASENDDRMTNIGRFLREHHLDELPQLWNVLVGDMTFVGYRPERQFFIDQIMQHNPDYQLLYISRPGVTSYATLYNGYTDTIDKMLKRLDYDLDYLRHRSLWLDAKILFSTFISIVGGKVF